MDSNRGVNKLIAGFDILKKTTVSQVQFVGHLYRTSTSGLHSTGTSGVLDGVAAA